jgi:hypothetical protein
MPSPIPNRECPGRAETDIRPSTALELPAPKVHLYHGADWTGLKGHGISPQAATEPFPLFTQEAIAQMRAEIFSEQVLAECQYSSTFNKNMVRGMGPAYVTQLLPI